MTTRNEAYMKLRRFVVTGPQTQLANFQNQTTLILNPVQANGKSILFTCPERHYETVINLAGEAKCAVEEWDGQSWLVVVDGQQTWSS